MTPPSRSRRSRPLPICAVLLAGGRGTRFWPRSRVRTPKQLLNITGDATMLHQTIDRLHPLVQPRNLWAVTNDEQAAAVRREMRGVPASHILAEPVGRNTAAAIGLAAMHLAREHGDALMAVLPSDSHIADAARYRSLMRTALEVGRAPGKMAVLGIPPTRAETGYGYIECGARPERAGSARALPVKRFTEKPGESVARKYVQSGRYLWNAGMFFWRASTFLENLRRFLPGTHEALAQLSGAIGTPRYSAMLRRIYPRLENISVDYAIMEPATRETGESRVFVIPARVGWSDIGSWAAVYELLCSRAGANVSPGESFTLDAEGNFIWSPRKFCAVIGVKDVVLVETEDALLLCSRHRSQDVGKVVKWLEEHRLTRLV
ncbi:MAG TPA: sugar phosphate nucleotidyltransferase [Candidatus Acidoferrales bacterium]|nr:sugar phosphate nucleotidyltransferase [Candidatus Acidoferrales bacterium]